MFCESIKYNNHDKKYKDDTVFQKINKKYLTLDNSHRKINNEHLKNVIEQTFIPLMKQDELFALLYKKIMYGGSFYKGTKYGVPNEFDLDFVLKLPIDYNKKIQIDTNHDNYGFVKIKMDNTGPMHPNWEKHRKILNSWINSNNYLDRDKFSRWMQAIFEGCFRKLSNSGTLSSSYTIRMNDGSTYMARYTKNGPAFTLIITTPDLSEINIDIVPCLEFNVELENVYRKSNGYRKSWMVVSKPFKDCIQNSTILWRLCFYEQEKELLQGDVKPVIRMMKKFRDTCNWKSIVSYYIETIFYHELEAHKNDLQNYLRASKTRLFMNALKKLQEALNAQRLQYYWHPKHNLFEKINRSELTIYANTLQKLITKIDINIEKDRYILAKVVLAPHEYSELTTSTDLVTDMGNLHVGGNQAPAVEEQASRCVIL